MLTFCVKNLNAKNVRDCKDCDKLNICWIKEDWLQACHDSQNSQKIGLSVSFCFRDIARGDVKEEDVKGIIAGTRCATREIFETVLEQYLESYWRDYPEAANIARRFWDKGLIDQPRVRGEDAPLLVRGHWK